MRKQNEIPLSEIRRRESKRDTAFLLLLVTLVGVFLIFGGIYSIINDNNLKRTQVESTAIITEITKVSSNDSVDPEYFVYIKYFVDGEEYNGRLGYWSAGMKKGQDVKIYYNPDNPKEFHSVTGRVGGLIMLLAGVICLLLVLKTLFIRDSSFDGYIVIFCFMAVGGGLIYFWKVVGIYGVLFGLLFFGVGIYACIGLLSVKFAPEKEIVAKFYSVIDIHDLYNITGDLDYTIIDMDSDSGETYQNLLRFKDAEGKVYSYRTNYLGGLKENNFYKITVKGGVVVEIGELIEGTFYSSDYELGNKKLDYWSGFYFVQLSDEKLEIPIMVALMWFIEIFCILMLVVERSIGAIIPLFLTTYVIYLDYKTKKEKLYI